MSKNIWEDIYNTRNGKWGDFPPEDLIRFIRRYKIKNKNKKKKIKILELGCGPGANIKFLKAENFDVYGIDISKRAILEIKKKVLKSSKKNFVVGDFEILPWKNLYFDGVIDNFSLYANKTDKIKKTYLEVKRVLKKKGFFFSKVWGTKTLGFNNGIKIEKNTFTNIKNGPCQNMGISHFFTYKELKKFNNTFSKSLIDINNYTEKTRSKNYFVEIFISQSFK